MTDLLLKVEGAGNDFLLGLGRWAVRLAEDAALSTRLCHRRFGVGADGTLALFPRGRSAVGVVYRNADGSRAAFCANGTRCAARAAVEILGLESTLEVVTDWATLPASVAGDRVTLELPPPPSPPRVLQLDAGGRSWDARLLEVGVPHLLVAVDSGLDQLPLEEIAPPLRAHPAIGPDGANVTFVMTGSPDRIGVRSWERGVEGETLSCGSGVVAAGLVWAARERVGRLTVDTRSGEALVVEVLGDPPMCATRLQGRARLLASVEPRADLLGRG